MRMTKKISLRTLAKALGLSPTYLCDLENGRKHWGDAVREKYEKALK